MKKLMTALLAGTVIAGAVNAEGTIKLTNNFGGNSDNTISEDFVSFNDDNQMSNVSVGDALFIDVNTTHVDSRVRLDFAANTANGNNNTVTKTRGFINVRPREWINFLGGNWFFVKYAIPAAYFAADDNWTNHGKLMDEDGFGGVLDFKGLKIASGVSAKAVSNDTNLNFGVSYALKDVFNIASTAQDVTRDSRSFSGYFGLDSVENFVLNVGYTYNYISSSYVGPTEHALQLSTGYSFEKAKLDLFGDFMMGLNNDYRSGLEKATYAEDGVPFWVNIAAAYRAAEDLSVEFSGSVKRGLSSEKDVETSLYPAIQYFTEIGIIKTGCRINFTKDGYTGFSIPLSWTYKISKTF